MMPSTSVDASTAVTPRCTLPTQERLGASVVVAVARQQTEHLTSMLLRPPGYPHRCAVLILLVQQCS